MLLARSVPLLATALLVTGCQVWRTEVQHPGGVVGAAADRTVFPAWSKQMQAYRGLVVGTALARMAERNAVNSAAATTAVSAMNGVAATTGRLYELATSDCYTKTQAAASWVGKTADQKAESDAECYHNAYSVLFEAKLPDLHESLYFLASAALPPDRFGDIAASLGSGNYIGALWSFLLTAKDTAATLHYGLSVARAATEQRGIAAGATPDRGYNVASAVDTLGKSSDQGAYAEIDRTAFLAMFSLMKESCFRVQRRIATTGGSADVKCRERLGSEGSGYNDGLNPGGQ